MTSASNIYGRTWSEKEYIIVLYYYFDYKGQPQHADVHYIRKLADLMGRTPHSVLYRMQNYASIDPEVKDPSRKGKTNITEFGIRLFKKWSQKRKSLKDCAEAFIRDEEAKNQPTLFNPTPVKLPRAFEKYDLLDEIGKGGFGDVFSCLNTKNKKPFAIKIINNFKRYDPESIHRFGREIRSLKSIRHQNVISIHEDNLEKEKDYPGFVMDLGEHTLDQHLTKSKEKNEDKAQRPVLGTDEAANIFMSILDAVEALHSASPSIIHRDINPNNILQMSDGNWVLADFSLAKFLPPGSSSTTYATGSFQGMGTAYYASPEQYRSLKDTDERTDIYALGVLLWELFSSEFPPPRHNESGLTENLDKIFQKAFERDPEDRFQSVQEMKDAFEQLSIKESTS